MADVLGFRVGIDASLLECKNIRSKFFIFVNLLYDRKIRDIEKRISDHLCIGEPISLLIGEFHLPSEENVRLLNAGDILKVTKQSSQDFCHETPANGEQKYLPEEIPECKTRKRKRNVLNGEANVKPEIENFPSEGCFFVEQEINNPEDTNLDKSSEFTKKDKKKKKSRHDRSELPSEYAEITDQIELSESYHCSVKERNKNESDKVKIEYEDSDYGAVNIVQNVVEEMVSETMHNKDGKVVAEYKDNTKKDDEIPFNEKKRRKRTRKRKNKVVVESSVFNTSFRAVSNSKASINDTARKHIRFSNSEVEDEKSDVKVANEVACSEDVNAGVDSVRNLNVEESRNLVKQYATKWDVPAPKSLTNGTTDSKSAFSKILSFGKSSMPKVYARKQLSTSMDCDSVSVVPQNGEVNHAQGDTETILDFSNYPLIDMFPKKGDVLAFKTLKMGADYTPQLSNYITGKVLHASEDTYQLDIRLLDGNEQLQQPKGKFDLENDAVHNVASDLHMNWNELVETRIIYP